MLNLFGFACFILDFEDQKSPSYTKENCGDGNDKAVEHHTFCAHGNTPLSGYNGLILKRFGHKGHFKAGSGIFAVGVFQGRGWDIPGAIAALQISPN